MFLLALAAIQMSSGFLVASFGQVSNTIAAFYQVSYAQVDWLTLTISIGSMVLCGPISWFSATGKLGFRFLILTAAFSSAVGFACLACAAASRLLFSLLVVGQVFNSIAAGVLMLSPSVFAVIWFPENQVGTAIGVNIMSLYVGNVFGFTAPAAVLVPPPSANSSAFLSDSKTPKWIDEDQTRLAGLFLPFFFVALLCTIFLWCYVTDHPPTPPTKAQELKQLRKKEGGVASLRSYLKLVKTLLKNRTYMFSCFVFGILFQVSIVEFTMLSQILREDFRKGEYYHDADVIGGYIMTTFSVAGAIGSVVGGKLIDCYKRYNIVSIVSSLLAFFSSVGLVFGFILKSLPLYVICSGLFGLVIQAGLVAIFEMATQETYPIDETFSTIWLTGIQTTLSIIYGELGRILFDACGGLSVLIFQSANLLVSVLLSCLMTSKNKRLKVEEVECEEESALIK